ncbi:urea ABC transporter permease subunit UrtB [Pseudoxanthobacter sp. M-2]|uniref:urea ABC transporter permease subunit UrtB n=1 Tax=Pseudoxanthobacter sp. M-2 TaxID=3078754 RepID=UPI0038FC497F
MSMFRTALTTLLVMLALVAAPVMAQTSTETLRPLVDALGQGGFDGAEKAIAALAATGDPAVLPIFEALGAGSLNVRKADKRVVLVREEGGADVAVDPLTGEVLGPVGRRDTDRLRVNNRLRSAIAAAVAGLSLRATDPQVRITSAESMFKAADPAMMPALAAAAADEDNAAVRARLEQALAASVLRSDASDDEKIAAVGIVAARGDRDALSLLNSIASGTPGPVQQAATEAAAGIESSLAVWGAAQNVWYGVSLGSVLLLAAIGLAITFGVMGVINMAHGEMVMIGAYTTFVVQEIIRTSFPGLFDWSLAIALPLAFCVSGLVGIAIERSVIRWLYGRPLETLLATWGISLILQQAVRTAFGPSNREVGNPSWMSGSFEIGQLSITYGRLWIVVFSLCVFAALMLLMRYTPFGLQMRAVTQNRRMASVMGIRTPWVDAMTFGLGSGIAGIAGVALSQIDNVSPNLGQSYIIDSFMVVVFGGVGNLWGTLVGALTLGVVNKFLEPYAGAVLGKILVLVFIILFIQKRPRGLFALKGRAVEA